MNKASNFVSTNHSRCFTPEFVSEFSASQLLLLLFKKLLMTLSIRKFFVGLFLLSFMTGIVQAQISPPGLGMPVLLSGQLSE